METDFDRTQISSCVSAVIQTGAKLKVVVGHGLSRLLYNSASELCFLTDRTVVHCKQLSC